MTELWQLPPAIEGTGYRKRTFPEKDAYDNLKTDVPPGRYTTTGTFPHAASLNCGTGCKGDVCAKTPHLFRVGVLFLDCDLVDLLLHKQGVKVSELPKEQATQVVQQYKAYLHNLPEEHLNAYLWELAALVNQYVADVTGQAPTYLISSGYGVHAYLWLQEWQGYGEDLAVAHKVQRALIAAVNKRAGYELADKGVKDAGSRVLRVPGSYNNKGPIPRLVQALQWGSSVFDLGSLARSLDTLTAPGVDVSALPSGGVAASLPTSATALPGAGSAGSRADAPPPGVSPTSETHPVDKLFGSVQERVEAQLKRIFTECPFFTWAIENPTKLGLLSWYGAATNIAAVAGELGRVEFHAFSKLDPDRYDPSQTDYQYNRALESVQSHGPMTYETFLANGDWQGKKPAKWKAPAAIPPYPPKPDIEHLTLDRNGYPRSTHGNLRKILRGSPDYGTRLRYNRMFLGVEYDGKPIDDSFYGTVAETLEDKYGVTFSREGIINAVYETANDNSYHPVAEYLAGLQWDGVSRIERVLTEVLGAEATPLHKEYLTCFLVAAVARGLCEDPLGVKVDTTFILHGEQGYLKSTFFDVLGSPWFSDTPIMPGTKDAYISLQRNWIIESQEFEHAYGKNIGAMKAFLSARRDSFRKPYSRSEETFTRRCVLVGTTNEDHFLYDPTGDRRFHILHVGREVNVALLRTMRDQVWAEAVALLANGRQHWLDKLMDKERADANSAYAVEEPWESLVVRWIKEGGDKRNDLTIEQVLTEAILKPVDQWKHTDHLLIGRILRKLGYSRIRRMIDGSREYRYCRPGTVPTGDLKEPLPTVDELLRRRELKLTAAAQGV